MENRRNFPSLTGLKGLFILPIIWFHTAPETSLISSIPGNAFLKLYGGSLGNAMFFVLSGFLLSWNYRDRIRCGMITFSDYFIKRLKKLYPAYFLSSATMLLLDILAFGLGAVNLKRITFDLLLQSGGGLESSHPYNGPGWFVSALFVCYLAYYCIAYHAKHPTAYRCALVFGIVWGYTLMQAQWNLPFCYGQNGHAFLGFFLGCTIAEIYPHIPRQKRLQMQIAAFGILLVSTWMMLRYGVEVIAGDTDTVFLFVFCPLTLFLAIDNAIVGKILESKPVYWLGTISIMLYFWHFVLFVGYRWVLSLADRTVGDIEFVVYIIVLIVWCILPSIWKIINNNYSHLVIDK